MFIIQKTKAMKKSSTMGSPASQVQIQVVKNKHEEHKALPLDEAVSICVLLIIIQVIKPLQLQSGGKHSGLSQS